MNTNEGKAMSNVTDTRWIVIDEDESEVFITTEKREREGLAPIATVEVGYDEPFEKEQKAAIRMISVAPEMLVLLREALDDIYSLGALAQRIRELIARAEAA